MTPLARLAIVFVFLLALGSAGCTDPGASSAGAPSTTAASSASPTVPALDLAPIGVTVDPPVPTQGETAVVTGSVNHAARVSIDGGPTQDVPEAGRWSLASPALPFGRTAGVVRVEDGVHAVAVNVTFVRLAAFTLEVKYGHYPGPDDSSTDLWMDVDSFLSAPQYEGKGAPHPEFANVHDVTTAWTIATGADVEVAWSESLEGFSMSRINGAGNPLDSSAPPYWVLEVNGAVADFGMTLMPVAPGDHVSWCLNSCNL